MENCFNNEPHYNDRTMGEQVFGKCSCTGSFSKEEIKSRCVQPYDPRRPKKPVAERLQQLIAEKLSVDPTMVEIYTLMGTFLYGSTGASAKIIFNDVEVSVRVAINTNKHYGKGVDVVMDGGVDVSLEQTAREIVSFIRLRQKQKSRTGKRKIVR